MSDRRVVCAAIRDQTGNVVCSARHFDWLMHTQIKRLMGYTTPWEQGFIDQSGQWLTRAEAWTVAFDAGQILRRCGGDGRELYSENLY